MYVASRLPLVAAQLLPPAWLVHASKPTLDVRAVLEKHEAIAHEMSKVYAHPEPSTL